MICGKVLGANIKLLNFLNKETGAEIDLDEVITTEPEFETRSLLLVLCLLPLQVSAFCCTELYVNVYFACFSYHL